MQIPDLTLTSDVLARHVKACDIARAPQYEALAIERAKRTRVKRACDRCARLKVKCDYESPCQRCTQNVLSCTSKRDQQPEERHREPTIVFPRAYTTTFPEQVPLYQMPDSVNAIATNNGDYPIEVESAVAARVGQLHEPNMDASTFTLHGADPVSAWNIWPEGGSESGNESLARSLNPEFQDVGTMAEVGLLSLDLAATSPNPFNGPFPGVEFGHMLSPSFPLREYGPFFVFVYIMDVLTTKTSFQQHGRIS